jgi:D-amino-acid oxidase
MQWFSAATDNGRQEEWDAISYRHFIELAENAVDSGVIKMNLTSFFNNTLEESGILSQETGKIWYESLVGGLRYVEEDQLREGAKFGFSFGSVVIDTGIYLGWYESLCFTMR